MAKNSRDAYGFGLGGPIAPLAPQPVKAQRVPAATDIDFELGTVWISEPTDQAYILTSISAGAATWVLSSPGASDVDTLTGDGGGAISPLGGNITLAGGTNVTSVGAVNTITFNMDAAISLATSVTAPLFTTAAADMDITAAAGQDILITMGDLVAGNKVSFLNSGSVEVASIDSNGSFTTSGLTFTGLLTANASATILTAGTALNLGSDNSGDAVNLGVGTTARAIGIGDSVAAHTITIGSVTGAASLDLLAGTGNFTLEGNVATTYAISNTGVNTGQVDIAGGTGARTINIGPGGTGAKTINIGGAASADVITIGDATGAGSLDLVAGTGNFTLEGNVATTYAISGTGVNTGLITIGGGTGAQTLSMMNVAGVKTVNLANGVDGNTVSILNGINTGAQVLNLASGANAANSTVNILGGVATAGTQTLNLATGASASAVNIGNATGATAIVITSGTGSIALASTGAGDITIDSDDTLLLDADGVLELNSSAGIIGIGNDADAFGINVGTGAAARTITIGNTTGATALNLSAGTGEITFTGTVKEIDAEFLSRSGDDIVFQASPIVQSALTTGAAPTGATGDVNIVSFQEGIVMEQFIIGAGQTIIAPRMDTSGLSIALDQTATEGVEYNFGAARANSRHAHTIGTADAFFFEVTLRILDISAGNPFMIGFRKTEANNAIIANYTDYALMGINTVTSATNVSMLTELNSGGQTATDSTDAWTGGDDGTTRLRVLVSGAGVVTFEIDGVAASAAPAFTFDGTDVVVPIIHLIQGADLSPVHIVQMKAGFTA